MENIRVLIKGLVSSLVFSVVLFLSAGRLNYRQGWIFLSAMLLTTMMNYLAIYRNKSLIDERSKPGEGIKSWDKLLLGMSALMYVMILVLAGLDSGRYHKTDFSWMMSISGILVTVIGQIIFLTARNQNKFFSTVVRIQKDRGHSVCDTGLYSTIRHPGYMGMIISLTGLPLITASIWSIVPTLGAIILLLIRTSLEDKTLMTELHGYADYAGKTRFKLIPWVW